MALPCKPSITALQNFNLDALDPIDYITLTFYTALYYNSIYPQVKRAHEE